jgi:undecaprenyl-diphosphatase
MPAEKIFRNRNVLWIFFSAAALLICLIFDRKILSLIQSIRNPILDAILGWFSSYTAIVAIMLVITSLFLYQTKKKKMIAPLCASFIISVVLTYIIKAIVQRARPFGLIMLVPVLNIIDFSFPSSHSASAFSTIAIFDAEFKRIKIFWMVFAGVIAFSRVYFAVHYPSDVVFGAILGYSVGALFSKVGKSRVAAE